MLKLKLIAGAGVVAVSATRVVDAIVVAVGVSGVVVVLQTRQSSDSRNQDLNRKHQLGVNFFEFFELFAEPHQLLYFNDCVCYGYDGADRQVTN